MATLDPNDFRKPSKGSGQVVIVSCKELTPNEICQSVLEGIVRDVEYPRADRQEFMEDHDDDECVAFYIDVKVRRGKVYKRKKA